MSSPNLPLTDQSSIDNSCENLINKETQTSTAYITDSIELIKGPSRPLPKGIKSKIEGNINILDCTVIKVPSDSKTTADFTDSFIKEIENSNLSIDDSISNQRLYCKEVAIPFLKTHLSECEDDVESLEKLVQDALEEFPEQPCFEIYEGKKEIEEKASKIKIIPTDTMSKSKEPQEASTMDNSTAKKSDKESDNTPAPAPTPTPIPIPVSADSSATKKSNENFEMLSEDKKSVSKPVYPNDVQKPVDAFDGSNKDKEIDKKLSIECISECAKKGFTGLKESASSCLEKIEIVIGIKKPGNPDEKPTYYLMEKQKPDRSASQNAQTETGSSLNSIKNLLHDHDDKIITMTETVKDIAKKCYQGSKDAVTFITSESTKFLNQSKSEENIDQNSSDSQLKRIEKTLRNLSTDSRIAIGSILFKKAESKPTKEPSNTDRSDSEEIAETPCIAEPKPPSAIKLKLCQMRDDLVTAKLDKSSPYDIPIPKEVSNALPESQESRIPTVSAIDRTPETSSASNMFTMLKSKFFSMFREEEQVIESENPQDEEEEDPFERFMEQ